MQFSKQEVEKQQSHSLSHPWSFYVTSSRTAGSGQTSSPLEGFNQSNSIGSCRTIEQFWGYWNTLQKEKLSGYQVALLKEKRNQNVCCGKWAIHCDRENVGMVWQKCLLNLIGEQFNPNVIGAVLRTGCSNVICIWMTDTSPDYKDKIKTEIAGLMGVNREKILFQMYHQAEKRKMLSIPIHSSADITPTQKESCTKCAPSKNPSSSCSDLNTIRDPSKSTPEIPIKSYEYPKKPTIKIETTNLPKRHHRNGRRVIPKIDETKDSTKNSSPDTLNLTAVSDKAETSKPQEQQQDVKCEAILSDIKVNEIQPKIKKVEKNISAERQNLINFVLASVLGMGVLILGTVLQIEL